MYTSAALLDLHTRAHQNLQSLIEHCRTLTDAELNREIPGFGITTVRFQLCHEIGAEEYWIGVLLGAFNADDESDKHPDIDSIVGYRQRVAAITQEYLRNASDAELNTQREMLTWGDNKRMLMPAHVFMRTLTHLYHHQGQILAMCRILGKPAGGMDFPIV